MLPARFGLVWLLVFSFSLACTVQHRTDGTMTVTASTVVDRESSPAVRGTAVGGTPTHERTTAPAMVRPTAPATATTMAGTSPFVAATCCGLFRWAAADWLMVYDRAPEVGTSLVNVATGERRWIARWFGTPAGDRIAVFDPLAAATRIVDWYGRVEAELATGAGAVASLPDGRRLAWLEVADERLPSSAIGRLATVVVYDTVEQRTYRLGQLRVGAVAWSGDGAHLVLIAETADGAQAGIWAAEAPWTQFRWIASGRFFVNLQPVPYSTEVVVTRVLSGEATQDGVWLIDAVDGTARALAIAPSYRVADGTIVVLDDPERALLQVYRLDDLRPCGSTHLTEPVAVDTWDVAPDGQWIAYWSAASQRVLVERLPTCEVAD